MPPILSEEVVQVVHKFESDTLNKRFAYTILGANVGSQPYGDVAVAFATAYVDNLLPLLRTDFVFVEVTVQGLTQFSRATSGDAGSASGTGGDPQVSLLTKKAVNQRGARARGRSYWPGFIFESTYNSSGIMDAGSVDALQDAFDAWHLDIETAGITEVIVQNTEGDSPPLDPEPIVNRHVVDSRAATQRRRLR